METHKDRIAQLTGNGALERERLARIVRKTRATIKDGVRRARPVAIAVGAAAVVAGAGFAARAVARRISARRKFPIDIAKIRKAFRKASAAASHYRPRPILVTLLLAALRSRTARRAAVAGAQKILRAREDSEDGAANGPVVSLRRAVAAPRSSPVEEKERLVPSDSKPKF